MGIVWIRGVLRRRGVRGEMRIWWVAFCAQGGTTVSGIFFRRHSYDATINQPLQTAQSKNCTETGRKDLPEACQHLTWQYHSKAVVT